MILAKKSLGQNFLIDKNLLEKITNTTDINNKIILEIGPGSGNLTSYILKKNPKKIFVIEKDNDLATKLENKFNSVQQSRIFLKSVKREGSNWIFLVNWILLEKGKLDIMCKLDIYPVYQKYPVCHVKISSLPFILSYSDFLSN